MNNNSLNGKDTLDLISDVVWCCQQDPTFLEMLVDEYIYRCSDEDIAELEDILSKEFGDT
tara:strand:+ start:373 stop:552 length:180 start_codon:yes stop_codon:yes gene_type:complete